MRTRFLRWLYLALFLWITAYPPGSAQAHPHVWVDSASEILFDEAGQITGIRHHWRFDEAFSAFAIQGLDENRDNVYTREELAPLAQVNVESLNEFDFFTFLYAGDYSAGFGDPIDYWLDHDSGQLILHFTLPLARPLKSSGPVKLEVYDPEYFVAFSLPSTEAVRLVGAPADCQLNVRLARQLDMTAQAALAEIGPDQRELPQDLKALTDGLDNSATIQCP